MLLYIPQQYRRDAVQESWVAHLEHRCPKKAMQNFIDGYRRRVKRFKNLPTLEANSRIEGSAVRANGITTVWAMAGTQNRKSACFG